MAVASLNLVLEKGTDFEATFDISGPDNGPVGLSSYTGISKIRKYPTSPKSTSFSVEIDTEFENQKIKISMGRSDTSDLSSGRNYFDVFLQDVGTGNILKVVEGTIIVQDSISV